VSRTISRKLPYDVIARVLASQFDVAINWRRTSYSSQLLVSLHQSTDRRPIYPTQGCEAVINESVISTRTKARSGQFDTALHDDVRWSTVTATRQHHSVWRSRSSYNVSRVCCSKCYVRFASFKNNTRLFIKICVCQRAVHILHCKDSITWIIITRI